MINKVVNQESKRVQNTIIIKTMRVPISDVLGSRDNIELLNVIKDAPSEFYDSYLVRIVDFMWQGHGWKVICFNIMYLMYPITLSIILLTSEEDIFAHKIAGMCIPIILSFIEIH